MIRFIDIYVGKQPINFKTIAAFQTLFVWVEKTTLNL